MTGTSKQAMSSSVYCIINETAAIFFAAVLYHRNPYKRISNAQMRPSLMFISTQIFSQISLIIITPFRLFPFSIIADADRHNYTRR